jgi:putative FmdB family regulatory protein
MKLIMFDFLCTACDATFEELVQPEIRTTACLKCGAESKRLISPVHLDRLGMAMQEGMPGAVSYFEKVHRDRKAIEERTEANHGDYGKAAGSD